MSFISFWAVFVILGWFLSFWANICCLGLVCHFSKCHFGLLCLFPIVIFVVLGWFLSFWADCCLSKCQLCRFGLIFVVFQNVIFVVLGWFLSFWTALSFSKCHFCVGLVIFFFFGEGWLICKKLKLEKSSSSFLEANLWIEFLRNFCEIHFQVQEPPNPSETDCSVQLCVLKLTISGLF